MSLLSCRNLRQHYTFFETHLYFRSLCICLLAGSARCTSPTTSKRKKRRYPTTRKPRPTGRRYPTTRKPRPTGRPHPTGRGNRPEKKLYYPSIWPRGPSDFIPHPGPYGFIPYPGNFLNSF
ncbi:unnamed protein product [Schistosoma curassoni]|nr:unnamed protein product [Schistosoma curassoni]